MIAAMQQQHAGLQAVAIKRGLQILQLIVSPQRFTLHSSPYCVHCVASTEDLPDFSLMTSSPSDAEMGF